jgi:hypothetical protein
MTKSEVAEMTTPATDAAANDAAAANDDAALAAAVREAEQVPEQRAARAKRSAAKAPAAGELRTLVRVSYDEADDFLDELAAEADLVEARILRHTVREQPPADGYGLSKVDVIAGYVALGQVRELIATAGADWHTDSEADQSTTQRRDELLRRIVVAGDDLGLDVRGGRFGSM